MPLVESAINEHFDITPRRPMPVERDRATCRGDAPAIPAREALTA